MRVERVVIDTNVLISGALRAASVPRAVVDKVRRTDGKLLFSDETFGELRARLRHSKFDAYVARTTRDTYLAQLLPIAEWVAITNSRLGCRDPEDDKFLETALLGEADCLITGDEDLLTMSPFGGIPIVRPADALRA